MGAFINSFVQHGGGTDELDGYEAVADGLWILKTSVHLREDLPAPAKGLIQGDQIYDDAALALHDLIL